MTAPPALLADLEEERRRTWEAWDLAARIDADYHTMADAYEQERADGEERARMFARVECELRLVRAWHAWQRGHVGSTEALREATAAAVAAGVDMAGVRYT